MLISPHYEKVRGARRVAQECRPRVLVSLKVLGQDAAVFNRLNIFMGALREILKSASHFRFKWCRATLRLVCFTG